MNAIASFPLRAKHWQISLLLFGIYFVAQAAFLSSFIMAPRPEENFGEAGVLFVFEGMVVLYMFCFLGWLWSMGSFLDSIVRPALRMKMRLFRFALIYLALYGTVLVALLESINPSAFAVIAPLHLLATFCVFYLLYFASKILVLAETHKPASFYDYSGSFFLIWFFPIGLWFIQPRINRLYAKKRHSESLIEAGSK